MKVFHYRTTYSTTAATDIVDITSDLSRFVKDSGVVDGIVTVFVPGSTASVTTIEYESGVLEDLKEAVERMIPSDIEYKHNLRWGDGNGYSHVRAALMGPSISVPISGGKPDLGTWQQVVLIDFDNKPRTRKVIFTVIGE